MADSVLPISLQGLNIAESREPSEKTSILGKTLNPFSSEGGACKKVRRVSSVSSLNDIRSNNCRMSLFGKKCTKLKSPTSPCECISHYVPSKFDPSSRNVLQVKPTSFNRHSNIIRKSTLNFLRFQNAKKLDLTASSIGNKVTNISNPNSFDESPSSQTYHTDLKTDPSSSSQSRDLFGRCVVNGQDFHSLISSNDKTVPGNSSLDFDTSTFRSRIRSYRRYSRRFAKSRSPDKSEDDETLSTVAKKLAATEISSATSASCSQQARLTANAYCDEHDISIDELASYFEDFVHIPKKMSLMAEQMYI